MDKFIELIILQSHTVFTETFRFKAGTHFIKSKTAPKSIVKHGKAAVSSIHHTNDVHILRNSKFLIRIQKLKLDAALIAFNQHKQFAKDLAQITAIDFVDDKEIVIITVDFSLLAEIVEGAEEIPEDWLDVEQYLVTNLTAAKDGKDPETIDEAYWNFQKTIGTFDTLVTLRDYLNFIVNEEFEQSSNGFITDRTNRCVL